MVAAHYAVLLRMARKNSRDPHDLLHHTYLRCRSLTFPDNPLAYMAVAMFREATRGQFKRMYHVADIAVPDVAIEFDNYEESIQREQFQIMVDRLGWFDRTILTLFLEGWKLIEISSATDIPVGTLYQSVHRSRKEISNAIRTTYRKDPPA
jgi:DNA-directed RNA polymerase specialized sigma24 family protein